MIVPMKRIAVIMQSKDAASGVKQLRRQGVVHVEHQQPPQGKDIAVFSDEIALVDEAINVLSGKELLKENQAKPNPELGDWKFSARHIVDLRKRIEQLEEYSRVLLGKINQWQDWGDFDPDTIKELVQKNIHIKLYQIPVKEIKNLASGLIVKKIHTAAGTVNCAVISQGEVEAPFKEIALPKMGLAKMRSRLQEDLKAVGAFKEELRKYVNLRRGFLRIRESLENELEFHRALRGMGEAGTLSYLSGYTPADAVVALTQVAKEEKWGLSITEPSAQDNIPTLIRNPKWISFISPVFKLLGIAPGYRELDVSLPFFIFFSIFFGMLIGDAGYGIVYLLLTFWVSRKFGKKITDKSYFYLFYILSSCAVIWGVLTGTIFGQEWLAKAGFRPLVPALNNVKAIQAFCFFLGALHLTIAHSWQAIIKIPSLTALSDVGWIGVLWAAFLLAKALILGDSFPVFGKWLIICGISLVLFFTHPQRNILKTIGAGLGTLALSLMNNFTDVVSYVRLFAVGLAGVAIADTFNAMASGVGSSNFMALLLSGFIVLAGHGLNLVLGPMSVLVHGVRLNVLEFSGHAGISWSGFAYKPLKEKI